MEKRHGIKTIQSKRMITWMLTLVMVLSMALPAMSKEVHAQNEASAWQTGIEYSVNDMVLFNVTSDWGSGLVAEVTIKNNGNSAINDWQLAFDLDNVKVLSLWNGSYSFIGQTMTVKMQDGTKPLNQVSPLASV